MDDIITAAMVIPGGVLLGIIILSFLQYHIRNNSVPCINPHKLKFFFRRFVSDFLLHRYLRSVGLATPLYLFALLLILAINTIVLTISKDPAVLRQRSGEAVLVNIILLLVCGRPNVFSERVHVSQQFKNFIHRWLGIIAMVECIVHLTAALTPIHSRPFSSVSSIAGLTAAISTAVLGVFSLPSIRRHVYELFLGTHMALTIIMIVAVFLHIFYGHRILRPSTSVILLIFAAFLWGALMAIRIGGFYIWNRADVKIFEENGLLTAEVTLTRARQVHAGQYVFLGLALYESHPFYITSWDNDQQNKTIITTLIQPRKGFTRQLHAQPTAVKAFIDGPYGETPFAEDYGNIILFASGIGIAAHLGCIKQLLDARDHKPTRTQAINLLWEVEEIEPWDAAIKMVHKLLDQDANRCDKETPKWENARSRFIFQYTLFIRQHGLELPEPQCSEFGRQTYKFGPMNAAGTLKQEMIQGHRLTRTLISVCANHEMTDTIRLAYANSLEVEEDGRQEIVLHTHEFQPPA